MLEPLIAEPTPTVGWLYNLRKEDLVGILASLEINPVGTLDELRKRFSTYLKEKKTVLAGENVASPAMSVPREVEMSSASICEQVRKWNLHFNGKGDAVFFLERLAELQTCYDIKNNQLLTALPELFREGSLLWLRNNRAYWSTWSDFLTDFKLQYLSPRYDYLIEEEIRSRWQKPSESFKDYVIALLTLMRRGKAMSEEEQLDRVYNNMAPEIKLYVRRDAVQNLRQLSQQAAEYEQIREEQRKYAGERRVSATHVHSPQERRNVTAPAPLRPSHSTYAAQEVRNQIPSSKPAEVSRLTNPEKRCWRCGQEGHTRIRCRNAQKLFCSRCGKLDIRSKDCRCQGNGRAGGSRQ